MSPPPVISRRSFSICKETCGNAASAARVRFENPSAAERRGASGARELQPSTRRGDVKTVRIGSELAKERHMRAFARRSCDPPIPLGIGKTTSKCQHIMQFRYQGEAAGCRDARDALLGLKPAGHACLPKLRASATGGCGSPIPLGIEKTTNNCQHIMQFRYQGEAAGCRAARNSISACRSLRDRTFGTFGCSPPHPSAAPTAPISCPPRT